GSRFQVIGLEVQQTTFGYARPGLEDVIFIKYKIVNKGGYNLEEAYIMIWIDPDLWQSHDDLVGCDTTSSLGYCYNSTNNDPQFGSAPPAVGFQIIQGLLVPTELEDSIVTLPDGREFPDMQLTRMTAFLKYINGTDPDNHHETYWYMMGLDAKCNACRFTNPITNEETSFFHTGDPVANEGWLDSNPADKRMGLSTGPFDLPLWQDIDGNGQPDLGEPGVQELVIAVLVGQGADRLNSISALKSNARVAHYAFWHNLFEPEIPAQPAVTTTALDEEIILYWDDRAEENDPDNPFLFEGYNVYQFDGPDDPNPARIATFDLINGVGTIIQPGFVDNIFGEYAVQHGSDSGLRRLIHITGDFLDDSPLQNGQNYYYAVTAYA
ncbi:MAG: hypothetical protein GY869_05370, partial [Planctomycetes bacterium]|nr:hypothetical protein [Planctomycetota bacterium]